MNKSAFLPDELNSKSISVDIVIVRAFAKIDSLALGIAVGTVFGIAIFSITNLLIFKGGHNIGQTLILLNQYFIGYTISFAGSGIGLLYGFLSGFILGWLIGFSRNQLIKIYFFIAKFKSRMISINEFID